MATFEERKRRRVANLLRAWSDSGAREVEALTTAEACIEVMREEEQRERRQLEEVGRENDRLNEWVQRSGFLS